MAELALIIKIRLHVILDREDLQGAVANHLNVYLMHCKLKKMQYKTTKLDFSSV